MDFNNMILEKNDSNIIKTADVLHAGGVVIIPCDTIYGLAGIAPDTEERIRQIKGRGENKPFLVLIKDYSWLSGITEEKVPEGLRSFWPGPLTVILPNREGGTTGVRIPKDDFLRKLLGEVGKPLYSTSVNRSGSKSLWKIRNIIEEFDRDVDLIIDDGDKPEALPSTVVDVSRKPFRVLREGAVKIPPEFLEP